MNSAMSGILFFSLKALKDFPNVKSEMISKNRSKISVLASTGVPEVACCAKMFMRTV
jgi:hypothetical protein